MHKCIDQLFAQFDLENYVNLSKKHIVIDAGHTSLGKMDGDYVFGHNKKHPSVSEENTLYLAFQIAKKLIDFQKTCTVNICFSDTTKNFEKIYQRNNLKQLIQDGNLFNILPDSYKNLIREYSHINVCFSLQTQMSNLSTKAMKLLKKTLKKINSNSFIFNKLGAFFIKDNSDDNFGFIHPLILNNTSEILKMGGSWWLEEEYSIHPSDLISSPLLKIKKNGMILLYSKVSGILCPGTYAGLLFNLPPDSDFISIYSRDDDPTIGEKVNSGVIAALTLSDKLQCRCIQFIITSGMKKPEICEISKQSLQSYKKCGWKKFFQEVNERGFLEKYQPYI